jgi:hypothetical protein
MARGKPRAWPQRTKDHQRLYPLVVFFFCERFLKTGNVSISRKRTALGLYGFLRTIA